MTRDQLLALDDAGLLARCDTDRFRGSGAGGQKRNKTSSSVRVRHRATGLAGQAGDSRSQPENRAIALRRLREHFAWERREPIALETYAPSPRLAALVAGGTAPLGEKTRQKPEYLVAMAELLDLFDATGAEVAATAQRLGISTGATSKLLLHDDRVARTVAQLRSRRGLRPLR